MNSFHARWTYLQKRVRCWWPFIYAHRTLEGASTARIREELWLTDRYARDQARQRERDEANRRWLAQRGRVVDMRQF